MQPIPTIVLYMNVAKALGLAGDIKAGLRAAIALGKEWIRLFKQDFNCVEIQEGDIFLMQSVAMRSETLTTQNQSQNQSITPNELPYEYWINWYVARKVTKNIIWLTAIEEDSFIVPVDDDMSIKYTRPKIVDSAIVRKPYGTKLNTKDRHFKTFIKERTYNAEKFTWMCHIDLTQYQEFTVRKPLYNDL